MQFTRKYFVARSYILFYKLPALSHYALRVLVENPNENEDIFIEVHSM